VIGYLAASIEWSKDQENKDKWKEWWENTEAKHYYFLAKDNIPFHSIIWPSILMGFDKKLQLPYDIPANEYLRLQGQQFSKSKGLGIWIPDVIKQFDVDAIRYYLSMNMPENKDANWLWDDFVIKNNDELVGTFGNFIHRVITFTEKNFNIIPMKGILSNIDKKTLDTIDTSMKKISDDLSLCRFKQGLKEIMNLAKRGNIYFNKKEPWKQIKTDEESCKTTLFVCIQIVKALSISIAPYLPFSANKIWEMIGEKGSVHETKWSDYKKPILSGYHLKKPKPLFTLLSINEIMPEINPFSKLDLRVAEILDVKDHPNADKLYMIYIDVGALGKRILVAGMKPFYKTVELKGKKIVIIANLEPAKIRGIKSMGMLLAAEDKKGTVTLLDPGDAKPGSVVKIKGISYMPEKILSFDQFMEVKLTLNEKSKVIYQDQELQTETGTITTDHPVEEGAVIH
jgi:methionyl-tRNA synthetase